MTVVFLTRASSIDRWPIFSSPSFCGSTTENTYTSPDLSATSSSSSAWVNTRDVHLLTTHLLDTQRRSEHFRAVDEATETE